VLALYRQWNDHNHVAGESAVLGTNRIFGEITPKIDPGMPVNSVLPMPLTAAVEAKIHDGDTSAF
jgi:hypothetical protein